MAEFGKKGKQSRGRDGDGKGRPVRRAPPPDATGTEAQYLQGQQEAGTRIVVELIDGERLTGTIQRFSADSIAIELDSGPEAIVRKTEIRMLHECG